MTTEDTDRQDVQETNFEQLYRRATEIEIRTGFVYLGLIVFAVWSLFPAYWLVTASLKTRQAIVTPPVHWIPHSLHFENYIQLFTIRPDFLQYIINSVIITIATTVIVVTVGACASYGFVTFDFPHNLDFHLPYYILSARFLPPIVTIIPLFVIYTSLGLVNTKIGLIITYSMFNIPFVVWMLKGFFDEIPDSLVDAAILDGHTHTGAFFKIVLPMVKPGLLAAAIFTIIITWNELLFAVILAHTVQSITVPVGLASFITKFAVKWVPMSVAATIALIPVLIFAFISRDSLVQGFSMGAVKK